MKSKVEEKLDSEFEELGVKPRVYHFTEGIAPFNAITIVDDNKNWTWKTMRGSLDNAFTREYLWLRGYSPATRFIFALKQMHLYGVAICDHRDQFNRKLGRIIAKGRLLKHLKNKGEEK